MLYIGSLVYIKRNSNISNNRLPGIITNITKINKRLQYVVRTSWTSIWYCDQNKLIPMN